MILTFVNKIYAGFDRLIRSIENVFLYISCVTLIVMSLLISANSLLRYLFNHPLEGVLEITEEYLMIILVFCTLSFTTRVGGHIKIEFISKHIPRKIKKVTDTILNLIALAFVLIISVQAWNKTLKAFEVKQLSVGAVEYIMWPAFLIVVLGTLLMSVRMAIDIVKRLCEKTEGGETS